MAGVGATEEWQKWRECWFLYHVVRLLSSAPTPQKTTYTMLKAPDLRLSFHWRFFLESEQSTLFSCRKHSEYLSTCKQDQGSYYSNDQEDHEEAENGEEANFPIDQVALTVSTNDDHSLPVFTFRVWVLRLLSCITMSFLNQFFSYIREPLTVTVVSEQIDVLPIGHFMAAALSKRKYGLPWTKYEFCLNPGPFNMKEHVLITIFAGAGVTSVTTIHIVNIVKIYYRRYLDLPVGLLIVITPQS